MSNRRASHAEQHTHTRKTKRARIAQQQQVYILPDLVNNHHISDGPNSGGDQTHPPPIILPPHPPPNTGTSFSVNLPREQIILPQLDYRRADLIGRGTIPNRSTIKRVQKSIQSFSDVMVESIPNSDFRCLLCGVNCDRGDVLYAHLLVLKHEFEASYGSDEMSAKPENHLTESSTRLTCRRCGRRWDSEVECQNTNQHGCVQQKAAFLSGFLAPRELVKQGLPFICLFCCTEPEEKGIGKRIGTGVGCQKARPVKLYESAMRFHSKLHLVVHILCRHAVRRKNGMCAECPFLTTNFPNEEGPAERAFWTCSAEQPQPSLTPAKQRTNRKWSLPNVQEDELYSSSESEPETVSPNRHVDYSILKREGLLPLEKHIDTEHLPNFELLTWYMSHSMPTKLSGGSAGARKAAMYSCPICDLNNYRLLPHLTALAGEDLFKYASDVQGKYCHISSNAMLQAHVACYHSGAKELDSLLEMCQVCETTDFMRISTSSFSERSTQRVQGSLKHLVRAGHMHRLQRQFDRCVNQGRLDSESIHVDLNWSTVCVFCWRRFATHLGSSIGNLLAQCRLQTHLIVQHCAQIYEALHHSRRETAWGGIRPCGWCGDTMHVHTELGELHLLTIAG
ncbi:hypothetical protein EG68_10902 [Paragonimus skrjabini miyazakii]|uniref:C2H2-type domain-containing protein n=1 Tax=Paragonimus skrjabini miyazakii TaxID=59628 RepID=A0A8S9YJW0_9TREM|nr:hypothetical protein EG68_10902 [Paragonimus skrjabini miyazakii]